MILTKSLQSAFALAYQGDFNSSIEMLGCRWRGVGLEPLRNGDSDIEFAETLLVCGFLTAEVGRLRLLPVQGSAKDLLSKSERMFGSDPRALEARLWLALTYFWGGESNEALLLLDSIVDRQTAESFVTFTAGHVRGLVLLTLGRFSEADTAFRSVEVLLETVPEVSRGKFFLNRGMLRRRQGRFVDALADYASASSSFREIGSVRYEGASQNNIAGILSDEGRFDEAHAAAQSALRLFELLGDRSHVAKVWDQIAQIFGREENYPEMERCAARAVEILASSDHEGWLAEALIPHGVACAHLGLARARADLSRALEICDKHGDPQQAAIATRAMWDVVRRGNEMRDEMQMGLQEIERNVYERVLSEHGGHISPAARALGYSHHHLFQKRLASQFPELLSKRTPQVKRRRSLFKNCDKTDK